MRTFRSDGLRFANLLLSSVFSNLLFQITLLFDAKVAIKIGNISKRPMIFIIGRFYLNRIYPV